MDILLILVVALLVLLFLFLRTAGGKGYLGEFITNRMIGGDQEGSRRTLKNFMFKDDFHTVEIDHIVIQSNGVFVIETKNYKGKIYGSETKEQWTQYLGNQAFALYNPIKQNWNHINYLRKRLGTKKYFHSIIVFMASSELKVKTKTPVVKPLELRKELKRDTGANLSAGEVEELYQRLIDIKQADNVSKREHVKSVQKHLRTKKKQQ